MEKIISNRSEIVNSIAKVMHQKYPDVQVYIYGSEARNEARQDSDIDVLILVNKDKIGLNDRLEMRMPLYEIELETGVQISPYFETLRGWNAQTTEFTEMVNRDRIAV